MSDGAVVSNYSMEGLADAILASATATAAGAPLTVDHLELYDQFHLGGRLASARVARALGAGPGDRVLDVGCGVGGPARHVASRYGAHVTGVDLTPVHIDTARILTARVGLADATTFELADATRLPFDSGTFAAAMMLFVGMNVEDKDALFAEVHRVLAPSSRFVVYDPVRRGPGQPDYPMPWAASSEDSFLATVEEYRSLLAGRGFEIEQEEGMVDVVQRLAEQEQQAPGAAGQQALRNRQLGADGPVRFRNLASAVGTGVVEPRLIVARRG